MRVISFCISLFWVLSFDSLAQRVDTVSIADTILLKPYTHSALKSLPEYHFVTDMQSKDFEMQSTENISDFLARKTAVYLKDNGAGGLATVSIRGTSAQHTKMLWNGIELNSPALGLVDMAEFPLMGIDQIFVSTGLNSLSYSSGALGATVNLTSLPSWKDQTMVNFAQRFASFGDYRTQIACKLGTNKWQWHSGFLFRIAENDYPYLAVNEPNKPVRHIKGAAFDQKGIFQDVYFKTNKGHLAFRGQWFDSFREIPSVITAAPAGEDQADKSHRYMAEWVRKAAQTQVIIRSAFTNHDQTYQNPSIDLKSRYVENVLRNQIRFKFTSHTDYTSDGTPIIGNPHYEIIAGANSDWYWLRSETSKVPAEGYPDLKGEGWQSGFLAANYHIKRWRFKGLVRKEIAWGNELPVMPSGQISYYLNKKFNWRISSSITRNYRFPSYNDLYWFPGGNPALKPEDGWVADLNLTSHYQLKNNWQWSGDFTGFYGKIDNWIIWLPGQSSVWTPENRKTVRNNGIELNSLFVREEKGSVFQLRTAYSFVQSINTASDIENDPALNNQLIYVPQHRATAGLYWKANRAWMSVNYQFTDQVFITSDHSWYLPWYHLVDLAAGYSWQLKNQHQLHFQVDLRNLWGEAYHMVAWRPVPGRNLALTLKYQFVK